MQNKLKQGEALFAEGKIEEAEKCFLEILNEDPKNKEAYNNLGVISFQRQDFEQALEYFTKVLEIDPFHKDAILNYSALLKSTNRFYDSAPILEKAIKRFPDDQEISRLLREVRQMRSSGRKIAVLCLPGLQSFLGDIVDYLKTKYDVRTCYSNNNQEIESAVKWADVVWLEWANELAVHVTNNMRCLEKKRVICRVHRYEVFSPFFSKIHWSLVDTTIFVAKFMSVLSQRVVPDLDKKTNIRVLYNGVNLEKFKFRENAPGFNLAVVGYIHLRKNPTFWPLVLSKLVEIDKRYTLHIAGEYQQVECKLYLEHIINNLGIGDNIRFYGHQDNIHSWLEDKNYLLSTSIHESFGYAIAEAMAMGIKPLIHRFPGSEELWPHHCLFNSIDEVIEMIHKKDNYNSAEYRKYIEQNYSLNTQLKKIGNILNISAPLTEKHTQNKSVSFLGSSDYWEKRYNGGGTSGAGSLGKLSEFKAEIVNSFVKENNIRSVIEFGCGDGNQLSLASYPAYIGLDVSETAIRLCKERFQHDKIKRFLLYDPEHFADKYSVLKADMVLSLDVIYHLIEDNVFELYMKHIFSVAEEFVIIYSSDFSGYSPSSHIKYHQFSGWIKSHLPAWRLLKKIPNKYPYKGDNRTGSLSDFYIYRKSCSNSALEGVASDGDNAKKKNDQVVSFIHEGQEVILMLSDIDEHLSGIIRSHKNFYELQMLDDIRKRVPPSGVFVDCGANIGNHGVYFGVICKASKVYAFEPVKETYNILLKNISLNKLEGTIIDYSIALGKENTNGKLIVRDANNLGTSTIQECPEGDIVIRKLDDIVFADNDRSLKGIDLVKIDVEGMELDVLRGAKKVINKFRPLLYVEIQTDDEFRSSDPCFMSRFKQMMSLGLFLISYHLMDTNPNLDLTGRQHFSLKQIRGGCDPSVKPSFNNKYSTKQEQCHVKTTI